MYFQIKNTLNNMKKSLLCFVLFLLVTPFLKAQNKSKISHVVGLKLEGFNSNKTLIYQLKDSTIQVIPYKYRKVFNDKTPDELAGLSWQMQNGHLADKDLGIPMQEYSVEMIDQINIRHRAARGRNMVIGMAAGLGGILIYLNSRNLSPEAFEDSFDWESLFLPPISIGLGAIAGIMVPTLGKTFRINRSRKKYEEQRAALGKYAILK